MVVCKRYTYYRVYTYHLMLPPPHHKEVLWDSTTTRKILST